METTIGNDRLGSAKGQETFLQTKQWWPTGFSRDPADQAAQSDHPFSGAADWSYLALLVLQILTRQNFKELENGAWNHRIITGMEKITLTLKWLNMFGINEYSIKQVRSMFYFDFKKMILVVLKSPTFPKFNLFLFKFYKQHKTNNSTCVWPNRDETSCLFVTIWITLHKCRMMQIGFALWRFKALAWPWSAHALLGITLNLITKGLSLYHETNPCNVIISGTHANSC